MNTATELSHVLIDGHGRAWIDNTNIKVVEVVRDHLAYGWPSSADNGQPTTDNSSPSSPIQNSTFRPPAALPMQTLLQRNIVAIQNLCVVHHVKSLHAFGSILREDFGAHSDVDLLVVFDRSLGHSAFAQFFDFKEALEALLKREVDLVSGHSIHNPFFQDELNKTKQTLYAA